jgi:hypothetical protein
MLFVETIAVIVQVVHFRSKRNTSFFNCILHRKVELNIVTLKTHMLLPFGISDGVSNLLGKKSFLEPEHVNRSTESKDGLQKLGYLKHSLHDSR